MPNESHEELLQRAMQNCASEPVHTPDAIQPRGFLLCLDTGLRRVIRISENVPAYLPIPLERALTARPETLLGTANIRHLQSLVPDSTDQVATTGIDHKVAGTEQHFHVTLYRSNGYVIVELEPENHHRSESLLARLSDWVLKISAAATQNELLTILARAGRKISGHDRALVYQFDEDWHSHVIAEDRLPTTRSFLDHRFPASDIPAQVRALYFRNPVRTIPDAQLPPVKLVSADDTQPETPLDLSLGTLRAVSPIHVRYLENMNLRASSSFAIVSDDRLWGLMSLHAAAASPLSPATRSSLLVLTRAASQRLFLLHAAREDAFLADVRRSRKVLSGERGAFPKPAELLAHHGDELQRLFRSSGIALVHRNTVARIGNVPAQRALLHLVDWLREQCPDENAWYSNELGNALPRELHKPMQKCCGLLAVSLASDDPHCDWLLLFRTERPVTQLWAGNPDGKVEMLDGKVVLSPKRSLDLWQREVHGHSEPWTVAEVRAGCDLGEDIAVLISALEINELRARAEMQNRALEQMNARLESIAHLDPLTNLWNRRRIEEAVDAELALAEREGRDFAVLLFDIDYFKRINDTYGHDVGDNVLKGLASIVNDERRGGDTLGRWGGEEFIYTASGADAESAHQIAERLRQRIAEESFEHVGQVTVSVGLTSWQEGDTYVDLVRRADQALYEAKGAGRNCTRILKRGEHFTRKDDSRTGYRH